MNQMSEHYKAKYGAWAGNPAGHKPDLTRCCEPVWTKDRWSRETQCSRPRGHGPGGAYCKQHDPAAVKARSAASTARYNEQFNKQRYNSHGRTFYDALVAIANGHNDARGLAQEVIDKFNAGMHR